MKKDDDNGVSKEETRGKDAVKKAIGSFQGLPKLRLGIKDSAKLRGGLEQLEGLPACSRLDRKLLAGVFDKARLKKRSEGDLIPLKPRIPLHESNLENS